MRGSIPSLVALLSATATACAVNTAQPDNTPEPVAPDPLTARKKVAEAVGPGGQKFSFYELGSRNFAVTQEAPAASPPFVVDEAIWQEGDPIKIFRAVAPNREPPDTLVAAVERARNTKLDPRLVDDTPTVKVAPPQTTHILPVEENIGAIAQSIPTVIEGGPTSSSNCSAVFDFDWRSLEGNPFCPAAGANTACFHDVGGSTWQNGNAKGGYSAICPRVGVPQLQLFFIDTNAPAAAFNVWTGNWFYVRAFVFGDCHTVWFPFPHSVCTHPHGFFQWNVPATGGLDFQQGVSITPE